MQKQHYISEEKIYHAFSMFDKNKDGKITAEEIKDVLGGWLDKTSPYKMLL